MFLLISESLLFAIFIILFLFLLLACLPPHGVASFYVFDHSSVSESCLRSSSSSPCFSPSDFGTHSKHVQGSICSPCWSSIGQAVWTSHQSVHGQPVNLQIGSCSKKRTCLENCLCLILFNEGQQSQFEIAIYASTCAQLSPKAQTCLNKEGRVCRPRVPSEHVVHCQPRVRYCL